MTVEEVFLKWRGKKSKFIRESSLAVYDNAYINHISPYIGDMDVCAVNKKKTVELMLKLRAKGLSIKYCGDVKIVLKMIVDFAGNDLDLDVKNTHWTMEWPQEFKDVKDKGISRYTDNEFCKIVEYAMNNPSPLSMSIVLTLSTGMRIGEVCALKWSDIDFETKIIRVRRNVERVYDVFNKKTYITIHDGKTESARRDIPITGEVLKLMKDFSRVSLPDYYVVTCSEKLLEPRTFRNRYRNFILNKVGLSHCLKFHAMRHTFASKLVESDVPIKIVSEILGHSDVSITLNTYSHPSDDSKRKAIQKKLMPLFRKKK